MVQPIRLRGISGETKGRVWESDSLLRAGRLGSLEIVLDDASVSRRHAEVRAGTDGWSVRDLDSTNGTYINGSRLGSHEVLLKSRDIVQFGKVAVIVEFGDVPGTDVGDDDEVASPSRTQPADLSADPPSESGAGRIVVEATASSSWEEAVSNLAFGRNRSPRPGEQLLAVLRASHHLVHIESEDELLRTVLEDAVAVLDAQRGAIVLAEGSEADWQLKLRALASGRVEAPTRFPFSQKLARRCFEKGESILCTSVENDAELKLAQSIADGAMASVLCVLLRTPRRRLGVLHLDRSFFQRPFTEDDLHLADALAASVSAGIECAQLMRKQRDLFLSTVNVLAQAVELRDKYTGGHTARVTEYAVLLARRLELSAQQVNLIEFGAPLHDVGKIGISDAILLKPGRLTEEEFAVMKTHTVKGAAILQTIPELAPVVPIVRSHHERWDGGGYPDGLAGEAIPLLARIVAVCDAFDAMTSNRPYHPDRRPKDLSVAMSEIEAQAGLQFDPECARAFVRLSDQVTQAMRRHPDTTGLFPMG